MPTFTLRPVYITRDGYDLGGVYWGVDAPLWHYAADPATPGPTAPDRGYMGDPKRGASLGRPNGDDSGYVRAATRDAAETAIRADHPGATFQPDAGGDLDAFTAAYITAALWSTNDNSDPETGGEPLDSNYSESDLTDACRAAMEKDCAAFFEANRATWAGACERDSTNGEDASAGHDFWLTRNGHGAGFWDGDWADPAGDLLTKAAKAFGGVDLYVGDDGEIHQS